MADFFGNQGVDPMKPVNQTQQVSPAALEAAKRTKASVAQSQVRTTPLTDHERALAAMTPEQRAVYERDKRLLSTSGPSKQREDDLHDRDYDPDKPYVRAIDPTAYQEQPGQKEGRDQINALQAQYAGNRPAPTAATATVNQSAPQHVTGAQTAANVVAGSRQANVYIPGESPPPGAPQTGMQAQQGIGQTVADQLRSNNVFNSGGTGAVISKGGTSHLNGQSAGGGFFANNRPNMTVSGGFNPSNLGVNITPQDAQRLKDTLAKGANGQQVIPAAQAVQGQTGGPNIATYRAPEISDVGPTQYARVGDVANVERTTLGDAAYTNAAGINDTSIARGDDLAIRGGQLGQLNRLDDLAQGRGPSLTAAQLQSGMEASIAAQQAVEASARGLGNVAGARRQAANSAAIARAAAAGQTAELGMQERLAAEQQLTSAAQGVRGQDIQVSTDQARITAAAEAQRSAQQQQANLANQAAENDRNLEQGRITAAEHSQNAQSINAQRAQQAELEQQAYSQTSSQAATRALEQARIKEAQGQQLASDTNSMAQTQAGIDRDISLANQEAYNRLNESFLDRDSKMKLAQLDVDSRKNLADLDAKLRTMGMDDAARMNLLTTELNQANILAGQGIAYDQAAVQRSIVRHNAGKQEGNFFSTYVAPVLPVAGMVAGGIIGGAPGASAGATTGAAVGQSYSQ